MSREVLAISRATSIQFTAASLLHDSYLRCLSVNFDVTRPSSSLQSCWCAADVNENVELTVKRQYKSAQHRVKWSCSKEHRRTALQRRSTHGPHMSSYFRCSF